MGLGIAGVLNLVAGHQSMAIREVLPRVDAQAAGRLPSVHGRSNSKSDLGHFRMLNNRQRAASAAGQAASKDQAR